MADVTPVPVAPAAETPVTTPAPAKAPDSFATEEAARLKAAIDGYPEKPAAPAAETESAKEPAKPEAKPDEKKAEAEAEKDPAVGQKLALIQRREKEQKAAHAQRLAELNKRETALSEREAKTSAIEVKAARAKIDPAGYLRAAGLDNEALKKAAEDIWYDAVGEAAPAEHRVKQQVRTVEQELAELKAARERDREEAAARIKAAEDARVISEYRADVETQLSKLPATLEYVGAYAAEKPREVAQALVTLQQRHADASPDAAPLSVEQLATMLEEQLAFELGPIAKRFKQPPKPAPAALAPGAAPGITAQHGGVTRPKKSLLEMTDAERLKEATRVFEGRAE